LLKICSVAALAALALFAFSMTLRDSRIYHSANEQQKVSKSQLVGMQQMLATASSGHDCLIISDSAAVPEFLVTFQREKVWEYAEIVTSCVFLNGAWMHPGIAGGRDLDGFPSIEAIKKVASNAALIFVGSEERLRQYATKLEIGGIQAKWDRIGGSEQLPAWKLDITKLAS
jgi:hypothetical protein